MGKLRLLWADRNFKAKPQPTLLFVQIIDFLCKRLFLCKAGCDMYLRRAAVCGELLENGHGPLGIDVLAENGDILHTFTISRAGFEYLRRKLKFRREDP